MNHPHPRGIVIQIVFGVKLMDRRRRRRGFTTARNSYKERRTLGRIDTFERGKEMLEMACMNPAIGKRTDDDTTYIH
jgi:hypothetical protein